MTEQFSLPLGPKKKPRVLVFDLETLRSAGDVGGWKNVSQMGLACGVCHDSLDGEFHTYKEADVEALVSHLQSADLVVGFNHIRFDYTVLRAYTDFDFSTLPNFDLLVEIEQILGHRLKLNTLVTATLGESKSADGMQSLQWVKEGRFDLVEEYCRQDVEVTKNLFEHGLSKGRLYYYDREGTSVCMEVHWSLSDLIGRASGKNL